MSTPGAEDASPSPDYSGDQDGSDMAELKSESQADDQEPTQKTANGSKPASNAKDPLRPRRKKARRACYACQRAHLTCSEFKSRLCCCIYIHFSLTTSSTLLSPPMAHDLLTHACR
jgi:hypothetical protein